MLTKIKINLLISLASCENPQDQVTNPIRVLDFVEPALEGSTVTFDCLLGPILSGPNISMCINGTWVPDPAEVNCTGNTIIHFHVS